MNILYLLSVPVVKAFNDYLTSDMREDIKQEGFTFLKPIDPFNSTANAVSSELALNFYGIDEYGNMFQQEESVSLFEEVDCLKNHDKLYFRIKPKEFEKTVNIREYRLQMTAKTPDATDKRTNLYSLFLEKPEYVIPEQPNAFLATPDNSYMRILFPIDYNFSEQTFILVSNGGVDKIMHEVIKNSEMSYTLRSAIKSEMFNDNYSVAEVSGNFGTACKFIGYANESYDKAKVELRRIEESLANNATIPSLEVKDMKAIYLFEQERHSSRRFRNKPEKRNSDNLAVQMELFKKPEVVLLDYKKELWNIVINYVNYVSSSLQIAGLFEKNDFVAKYFLKDGNNSSEKAKGFYKFILKTAVKTNTSNLAKTDYLLKMYNTKLLGSHVSYSFEDGSLEDNENSSEAAGEKEGENTEEMEKVDEKKEEEEEEMKEQRKKKEGFAYRNRWVIAITVTIIIVGSAVAIFSIM